MSCLENIFSQRSQEKHPTGQRNTDKNSENSTKTNKPTGPGQYAKNQAMDKEANICLTEQTLLNRKQHLGRKKKIN